MQMKKNFEMFKNNKKCSVELKSKIHGVQNFLNTIKNQKKNCAVIERKNSGYPK